MGFLSAHKKKWPQFRHSLSSGSLDGCRHPPALHTAKGPGGSPWGHSAQADCQCWLTQAQMSLLVSMSPAEPITPQARLKSGPHPRQVTPPVTQSAPVKLRVPPPPASLLHAGMLSERHLGMQHQTDLTPKLPAPGQGWKVLGNARRDFSPSSCTV